MTESIPPVIVLGCHRSGTSTVAGMLDTLGVRMGPVGAKPDWIGVHWSNPTGHYEHPEFVDLNGYLMPWVADRGVRADDCHRPLIPTGVDFNLGNIDVVMNAVERNRTAGPWGFKDPWTVFTFGAYEQFRPKVVFVARDSEGIAKSLHARDGTTIEEGRRIAGLFSAEMYGIAHRLGDPSRWISLSYKEILEDPLPSVNRLVEFAGVEPDPTKIRWALGHVHDPRWLRQEAQRLAREELWSFPKYVGWLLKRDRFGQLRTLSRDLFHTAPEEFWATVRAARGDA